MSSYDRASALKALQGYDLAAQIGAANFFLSVASNRDIVDLLLNHLFESYEHDEKALKTKQKTGQKYYREVALQIFAGLTGAASPLGPGEKIQFCESIVSDHQDSRLRFRACMYLSYQDESPVDFTGVESMMKKDDKVLPECEAVDLSRFVWESRSINEKPDETPALVGLVLDARPDILQFFKEGVSSPQNVRRARNGKLATWAFERCIKDAPDKVDVTLAINLSDYIDQNQSILMGVKTIPPSTLKLLAENSRKISGPDFGLYYADPMIQLLKTISKHVSNKEQAVEIMEALPEGEAEAFVGLLTDSQSISKGELHRINIHRMMKDPKKVNDAIQYISSNPSDYVKEAIQLLTDEKYATHLDQTVKRVLPALAKVIDKSHTLGILANMPDDLMTNAILALLPTGRIWSPSEMVMLLETESEECSQKVKEYMTKKGLGSLVPYDLERRRRRRFAPLPIIPAPRQEKEL